MLFKVYCIYYFTGFKSKKRGSILRKLIPTSTSRAGEHFKKHISDTVWKSLFFQYKYLMKYFLEKNHTLYFKNTFNSSMYYLASPSIFENMKYLSMHLKYCCIWITICIITFFFYLKNRIHYYTKNISYFRKYLNTFCRNKKEFHLLTFKAKVWRRSTWLIGERLCSNES